MLSSSKSPCRLACRGVRVLPPSAFPAAQNNPRFHLLLALGRVANALSLARRSHPDASSFETGFDESFGEGLRGQLAFWIARLLCIRVYMSTVTIPGGSDEAGHKRYGDCGLERAEPQLQEALISQRTETLLGAILFDHLVEKSGIRGFLRHSREQVPIPPRCKQEAGGRPSMPLCEFPDSFGRDRQATLLHGRRRAPH